MGCRKKDFSGVTIQSQSMILFPKMLEISSIHNAEFIMLNDFAKPKETSKLSQYCIPLCIMHSSLCMNECFELSKD